MAYAGSMRFRGIVGAVVARCAVAGCAAGLALAFAAPVRAADAKPPAFVEAPYYALTNEVTRKLILRGEPASRGKRIGELPAGARGIEGKGCRGPSDVGWEHLSPDLRSAMSKDRWCRVRWQGVEGWVSARYLRPDGAPEPVAVATPTPAQAPTIAPASPAPTTPARPVPKSDAPFVGPEWRVTAVAGVEFRDAAAWLRFGDGGEVEGHTGCNLLRASYVAGTAALRFGPLAVTRLQCPDDALARQERLFLTALEAIEAQYVASGALRLIDNTGGARIVLRAAKP